MYCKKKQFVIINEKRGLQPMLVSQISTVCDEPIITRLKFTASA